MPTIRRISVFALLVASLFAVIPATPAAAIDGLAVRSSTTFKVQPDSASILVEATYSITNVTPNRTRGGVITQYYYSGLSIPVPIEAIDVSATRSDGRSLNLKMEEPEEDALSVFAEVPFGRNIFYRKTTTFTVLYTLPSGQVRSDDSGIRVNPAYAVFGAYGVGDPNAVSVRVEVPLDFDVEVDGSDFTSTEQGDIRIYESTDIENPEEFYLFVVARNDDALETRSVDLPDGKTVNIQHWPGDDEWAGFVEDRLLSDFVMMQEMIGLPFEDEELEIIESIDPSLQGYAGWYIPSEELIEVSEDLDSQLILHELSHAWFNGDMFKGRWITEGLAEEFSAQAIAAAGDRLPNPTTPTQGNFYRSDLNAWFFPTGTPDEVFLTDQYGYNASWYIMRQLSEEVGVEGLAQIVQEAQADQIAYRGEGEVETVAVPIDDWRRFLDLAQERADSAEVEGLFRDFVVQDFEIPILDRRAEVRADYAELAEAGGDWAVPYGVRDQMGRWTFASIDDLLDTSRATLTDRDAMLEVAEPLQLAVPETAELAYQEAEGAEDLTEVQERIDDYRNSASVIASAKVEVESQRGLIERIGLIGTEFELPYEESRNLFEADDPAGATERAQETVDGFGEAASVGQTRLLLAVAALIGLILLVVLAAVLRRKKRNKRDGTGSPTGPSSDTEPEPPVQVDPGVPVTVPPRPLEPRPWVPPVAPPRVGASEGPSLQD